MPPDHTHIDPSTVPEVADLKGRVAGSKVLRGEKRYDYQNPPPRTKAGQILAGVEEAIRPVLDAKFPGHRIESRCLAVVPPGEPDQPWHCDLDGDTEYHTVLVPLTPTNHDAGGTDFERGIRYTPVRGLVYWFDGDEGHRGVANRSDSRRIFAGFVVVPHEWEGDDCNIML